MVHKISLEQIHYLHMKYDVGLVNEGSISKDNIAGKYNAESWNLPVDNVHGLNILSILSKPQHEWKKELFLMCKQD